LSAGTLCAGFDGIAAVSDVECVEHHHQLPVFISVNGVEHSQLGAVAGWRDTAEEYSRPFVFVSGSEYPFEGVAGCVYHGQCAAGGRGE